MTFTAEYDEKLLQWVVVRWDIVLHNGARSGTTIDRCINENQAQEIAEAYNTALI